MPNEKILVVDDDPDLVEAIRVVLESKDYQVLAAGSAPDGLALARRERPDLILLDVMMPEGTEGFHFVWTLRREAEAGVRDIPIIVLTAIHDKTELRFYPDTGDGTYEPGEYLPVQDFLDKPIAPAELLKRVAQTIKAAGSRPSAG
jgi:CheY-like chemotaxis protein